MMFVSAFKLFCEEGQICFGRRRDLSFFSSAISTERSWTGSVSNEVRILNVKPTIESVEGDLFSLH